MTIINKSFSPFIIFFNEKNCGGFGRFLTYKMTLKVRIVEFSTFNSKTTERLAVFVVLWPY